VAGGAFHPFPTERVAVPLMQQAWTNLTFLHWPCSRRDIERLIPGGLELDMFDGKAWVTLSPFAMEGFRGPGNVPYPWISRALEANVRTYVLGPDGRPGIWFLSLDIDWLSGVVIGRALYRLPYMWSKLGTEVDGSAFRYRGRRRWGGARASWSVDVERDAPLGDDELEPLDHFLTARWVMFARYGPMLTATPVEHEPWPLWSGHVVRVEQDLLAAAGIPLPTDPPLVHLSPGVHARVGVTKPARRAGK
jgi:uncharacterized protein